jgi:hypothetical protein
MKKLISFKLAVQLTQVLFGLLILFHLAVILGILIFDVVPIDFLWGGRMESKDQLLNFEIFSLVLITFCLFIVLIRSEQIRIPSLMGVAKVGLWILFSLFVLNTVGNLLAKTTFEKSFAIITALLSVFCLRLALESTNKN